jgi:hypothetical protein
MEMTPSQWTKSFFVVSLVFRQAGRQAGYLENFLRVNGLQHHVFARSKHRTSTVKENALQDEEESCGFTSSWIARKIRKTSEKKIPVHQKNYG